jgi:hypothetical protein
MSETPERPKNVWQARREALAAAIKAWQECESDGSGPLSDADSLADELREAGLILLPESSGYGQYIVSIDGEPAPFPDGRLPAGPVTGEMAADMFLTLGAADDYGKRQISIRPATDAEMVGSLVGETTLRPDPVRIVAESYGATFHQSTGRTELHISDANGRTVTIDLGTDGDEILMGFLDRDDDAYEEALDTLVDGVLGQDETRGGAG